MKLLQNLSVCGRKFFVVLSAAGAVAAVLTPSAAKGALSLTLTEPGFALVTGTISGGMDSVTANYGDFTSNLVIGYSNSTTPGSLGQLQIESLDVVNNSPTGSAPKTLTITFTDTGFTFPGLTGAKELLTSSLAGTLIGGTVGDKFTFQSTATPTGGTPATPGVQNYSDPTTGTGTQSFNIPAATAIFTSTGSYTLSSTIVATFSTPGENANLSGTATVSSVPEPMSLSAVAIAAGGLLLRRRRFA